MDIDRRSGKQDPSGHRQRRWSRSVVTLLAMVMVSSSFVALSPGVAGADVREFSEPGIYTFTVPTGITSLTVLAAGARGGAANGGSGAIVAQTLTVTPGQELQVTVGGGAFGGGGAGGFSGGGGASDVRTGAFAAADRVVVAGGGGGGTSFGPGSGGDASSAGTGRGSGSGGAGGIGGAGGASAGGCCSPGAGGDSSTGGQAGNGNYGGGGGGGGYGGGGGGGGGDDFGAGGGGGGGSLGTVVGLNTLTNGWVSITYAVVPTTTTSTTSTTTTSTTTTTTTTTAPPSPTTTVRPPCPGVRRAFRIYPNASSFSIAAYLARNCSYRIETRRVNRRTAQFMVPSNWPRSRPLPRAWWY